MAPRADGLALVEGLCCPQPLGADWHGLWPSPEAAAFSAPCPVCTEGRERQSVTDCSGLGNSGQENETQTGAEGEGERLQLKPIPQIRYHPDTGTHFAA